jgi:seryl-tRNA synthetase
MTSEKPQVRLEEWLEKDLEDYMKHHKLKSRTKALHQYIIELNQQKEESAKGIKRSKEEARHYHKKAERLSAKAQKASSTSKPQQQQWKVTLEFINKWLPLLESGQIQLDPFHCPYEEGKLCYRKQRQDCRRKTRSKYDQCLKDWQIWFFNLRPHR